MPLGDWKGDPTGRGKFPLRTCLSNTRREQEAGVQLGWGGGLEGGSWRMPPPIQSPSTQACMPLTAPYSQPSTPGVMIRTARPWVFQVCYLSVRSGNLPGRYSYHLHLQIRAPKHPEEQQLQGHGQFSPRRTWSPGSRSPLAAWLPTGPATLHPPACRCECCPPATPLRFPCSLFPLRTVSHPQARLPRPLPSACSAQLRGPLLAALGPAPKPNASGTPPVGMYSPAPHNDILVKEKLHARQRSHKMAMELENSRPLVAS